jgi:hypothetical protein
MLKNPSQPPFPKGGVPLFSRGDRGDFEAYANFISGLLIKKAICFKAWRSNMAKRKINITMDDDLIEYAKIYAAQQRTTLSEVFSQFILTLKCVREDDPTETIMGDPLFRESLLKTISRIQSGDVKWLGYKAVF